MPLPPGLDEKIRSRFDELIERGNKLLSEMKEQETTRVSNIPRGISDYEALVLNSCSLIKEVLANSERSKELQQNIAHPVKYLGPVSSSVKKIIGILEDLKDDYESGFLDDLEKRIAADISADYMGQAEALLGEGIPGQYDHVPAAVLCGAVLEDYLRRLCQRQPSISITKSNGQYKTLGPLIGELEKAKALNKLTIKRLQGWAQIRNDAAHGQFNEFTREDVESMLKGVKTFIQPLTPHPYQRINSRATL